MKKKMYSIEESKQKERLIRKQIKNFQWLTVGIEAMLLVFSGIILYVTLSTGISDTIEIIIVFLVSVVIVLISGIAVGGLKQANRSFDRFTLLSIILMLILMLNRFEQSNISFNISAILVVFNNMRKTVSNLRKIL